MHAVRVEHSLQGVTQALHSPPEVLYVWLGQTATQEVPESQVPETQDKQLLALEQLLQGLIHD